MGKHLTPLEKEFLIRQYKSDPWLKIRDFCETHNISVGAFQILLWCQSLRWMNGFLLGPDAIALKIIAHRDHQQVAAAPFSDTCHVVLTSLSLASFLLRPVLQAQHTART